MTFFPFKRFRILSLERKENAFHKLSLETDKRVFLRFKRTSKKFEGVIKNDRFKINRILNYRNNFYPIISGKINSQEIMKTEIQITIRLTVFAIIFMSFWFLMTIPFFISSISEQLQDNKFEFARTFWPFFFVAFPYTLMILLFNYEANKAKRLLVDLF